MEYWKNLSLEDIDGEVWKPIIGFENYYEISNIGRVKVLERIVTSKAKSLRLINAKILKQKITAMGYCAITLTVNYSTRIFFVHRLVAIHFIDNTLNKPYVNHIDGVKNNNLIHNLEWVTASENCIHSFSMGLSKISEKNKYINRCRTGSKSAQSIKVIDFKTGVIFVSITDAAYKNNIRMKTLWQYLTGLRPNKTSLKFYQPMLLLPAH